MSKKIYTILVTLGLTVGSVAHAAPGDVLGRYWFPDRTGQVEIYQTESGAFMGKVISYDVPDQKDENNPDPKRRGQPYVGSFMFENFVYNAKKDRWEGGTIYDARDGKTYKCRIWFDDDQTSVLNARGYVGSPMFGRTEEFERVTDLASTR